MDASLSKYIQLLDESKFAIAKVLKSGKDCEIRKTANGISVAEVKRTVVRR
jgi:hypothetical protein